MYKRSRTRGALCAREHRVQRVDEQGASRAHASIACRAARSHLPPRGTGARQARRSSSSTLTTRSSDVGRYAKDKRRVYVRLICKLIRQTSTGEFRSYDVVYARVVKKLLDDDEFDVQNIDA